MRLTNRATPAIVQTELPRLQDALRAEMRLQMMCAVAPRRVVLRMLHCRFGCLQPESHMYIGGLLGTILVIALIVYVLRRA